MKISWLLTRIVLPVGLPLMALAVALILVLLSPSADRADPSPHVAGVEVLTVQPTTAVTRVRGSGVVAAARRVALSTEVTGKVVQLSDHLLPGGRFQQGDMMLRVDARDYRAALTAEEALLSQAQLEVALEKKKGSIAAREWEMFEEGRPPTELALRAPQLAAAMARLSAREAAVTRAESNLSRTVLRAPFEGVIVAENAEIGQLVGPGSVVATLVGTEEAWVTMSVPLPDLRVLSFGGELGGTRGVVKQRLSDGSVLERDARVLRLIGELDATTRTPQVLVQIQDPMSGPLPLLPGAYVEVELAAGPMSDAFVLPRGAVQDGEVVWVVSTDDVLERRVVTIGWRDEEVVVVREGLVAGERVVTSPLSFPVEGAPVRVGEQ